MINRLMVEMNVKGFAGEDSERNSIMAEINPTLSVVTFNVNGLNTSMRRQRLPSDFRKAKT